MSGAKGKIGVLIEEHFDATEFRRFNEYFPAHGYEVEYISHLWGQPALHFGANPDNDSVEEHVTVTTELNDVDPSDYKGILLIGAYAMDRLRYQSKVKKGEKNQAPGGGLSAESHGPACARRHHLPQHVAVLRRSRSHPRPQGHLRAQHHLRRGECRRRGGLRGRRGGRAGHRRQHHLRPPSRAWSTSSWKSSSPKSRALRNRAK